MGWLTDKMMDVLEWNEHFEEYIQLLEQASDSTVGILNDKLAKIRETDDAALIEDSLRMMGYELSMFTQENRLKFYEALAVLPQFHQLQGSPNVYKILELLLDTNITVEHLYTSDYTNFYPTPQGRMVYEGGSWYMTSHVKLGVEDKNKFGEDADAFLQEAFYKFAPIEEVLESVSDLIRIYLRLGVTALVWDSKRIEYTQLPEISKAYLVCPTKVVDQESYEVHVRLVTSEGSEFTEIPEKLYASEHYSYDNGIITFDTAESEVTVSGQHRGQMFYEVCSVLPSGRIHAPDATYIKGKSTVAVNEKVEYLLMGVYGNHRRPIDDQENVIWSSDSEYLELNRGEVTVIAKPQSDKGTTLTAEYLDSNGLNTVSNFNINVFGNIDPEMPTRLAMWMDDEVNQGTPHKIRTSLIFDDRSEEVKCNFTLSTTVVTIDPNQYITGSEAGGDYVCVVLAQFEYKGELYQAQGPIRFIVPRRVIQNIYILGSEAVDEDSSHYYKCMIDWADGDTSQVSAEWSSALMFQTESLSFTGNVKAEIDSVGRATFPKVTRDSTTIIRATVFYDGVSYNVAMQVAIRNVQNYIRYVEVLLSEDLLVVGQRLEVYVLTHWNNGQTTHGGEHIDENNLYVEYDRDGNTNEVSLYKEDGRIYVDFLRGNASTGAKVRCIYMNSIGDTLETYKPFSLAVQTRSILELVITGPDYVYEGSRIALGCRVKWDTGVWADVVPTWEIDMKNTKGNFTLREIAYIVRGRYMTLEEIQQDPELSTWDDFQLASDDQLDDIDVDRLIIQSSWIVDVLETNPSITLRAVYGNSETEKQLEVRQTQEGDTNVINYSYIDGPTTLSGLLQTVSYELMVKYANDCPIQSITGVWSCDADTKIVEMDEEGFLTVNSNEDAVFNVTVSYVCGTNDITLTQEIHLVKDGTHLDRVDIIGPSTVAPDEVYEYDISVIRNVAASPLTSVEPVEWELYSDDPIRLANGYDGSVHIPLLYHDTSFIIEALYTEQDPESYHGYETAIGRKEVNVISPLKITSVRIVDTETVKDTDETYQLKAEITRANGDVEIIDSVNSPDAIVTWRMFSKHDGIEMTETGLVTMDRIPETVYIDVQVVIFEGRTNMVAANKIRINSQSTPQVLEIVSPDTIRDMSQTELIATALLIDGTREDYSTRVDWSIKHNSSETISIVEGVVTAPLLVENATAIVSVRLEIGDEILSAEKEILIRSTAPKYDVAPYGINTPEECDELKEVMHSVTGGSIVIHAPKNIYGYFLCRSDLGEVNFIALDDNLVEGWDGANRQSDDYDHITGPKDIFFEVNGELERWWLFRTNNAGFGSASFAVTFTK